MSLTQTIEEDVPGRTGERYLIISTDSHIGPSYEALREYCPASVLGDYDDYVAVANRPVERTSAEAMLPANELVLPDEVEQLWVDHNRDPSINDPALRLANMDADGISAEVIFHGLGAARWGSPDVPFQNSHDVHGGVDLAAVGKRIYNRWLADFCATDPARLIGVAELPFWDIDSAVKEIHWAAEHGFTTVSFPSPRAGLPTYENQSWEPFWAAIEETDTTLSCHSGVKLHDFAGAGVAYNALYWAETGFVARAPLAMMCFGGVFQRHPRLRVVFNEQRGYWVRQQLRDLDSIYLQPWNRLLRDAISQKPSDYWHQHCFVGGSFMAHFELEYRDEIGVGNITWGRDFPHPEGTWPHTRSALQWAFFDLPEHEVRTILGDNAARCYRVDTGPLQKVSSRIGPTPAELATPLERTPVGAQSFAFRDRPDNPGGPRLGAY